MIDPIIFSFNIGGITIALRWYGVLVMTGVVVAAWLASKEVERRGENADHIWDALVWMIPAGMVGARLWYVLNATIGGNSYYLDNPLQILNIPQGGLHFFGGLLFGAIALLLYARKYRIDLMLFLDSLAPMVLIGQAIARPANFINQELYGPPTSLPWGIRIDALHRIPPYSDLMLYPFDSTRFHPTFAYEILWNVFAALCLIWVANQFEKKIKPGTIFYGWLLLSGIGRTIIETWRPDQPLVSGLGISFTRLISILIAVAGAFLLLIRFEVIRIPFIKAGKDAYTLSTTAPETPEDQV